MIRLVAQWLSRPKCCWQMLATPPIAEPHLAAALHDHSNDGQPTTSRWVDCTSSAGSPVLCHISAHLDIALHEHSNDGEPSQAEPQGASLHFVGVACHGGGGSCDGRAQIVGDSNAVLDGADAAHIRSRDGVRGYLGACGAATCSTGCA